MTQGQPRPNSLFIDANGIRGLRGAISDLDELAIKGAKPSDLNAIARMIESVIDAAATNR